MEILLSAVEENINTLEEEQSTLNKKIKHQEIIAPDSAALKKAKADAATMSHKIAILQGIANAEPQYEDIRLAAREAFTALSGELGDACSVEQEVAKLLKFAKNAEVTYLDLLAEIRALKKKAQNQEISQEELFAQLMELERQVAEAQIRQDLFIFMSSRLSHEIEFRPEEAIEQDLSILSH